MATTDDVERLVAPAVTEAGLELVDVELTPAPRVLRVRVDAPGGVDLDLLGGLTRTISRLLDEADAVPGGRYDLEVSSPGVERPLRRREHFAAAVGSPVRIRTRPGADGPRRAEGVLTAADEEGVVVAGEAGEAPRRIRYEEVERAHTVFDWRAAFAADSARPRESGRSRRAARREGTPPPTTDSADPAADRERAATP